MRAKLVEDFTYLKPKTQEEIKNNVSRMDKQDILNYSMDQDDEYMMELALKKGAILEYEDFERMVDKPSLIKPLTDYIVKTQPFTNFTIKKLKNGIFRVHFDSWDAWTPCFSESRELTRDFIDKVFGGENDDMFFTNEWSNNNDIEDLQSMIESCEHLLQPVVKEIKMELLVHMKSWDQKNPETKNIKESIKKCKTFTDIFNIIKSFTYGDFEDIIRALQRAADEAQGIANESEVYEDLKKQIIKHFSLTNLGVKDPNIIADLNHDNLIKLSRCLLADGYPDDERVMIDFSPPYYGWTGSIEDFPDVFVDAFNSYWEMQEMY